MILPGRTTGLLAVLGGLGLFAATGVGAQSGAGLERGNKPGEWRYWGADAWSTRYSDLDQINASNFNSLQVAWQWDAGKYGVDEYYRSTPLYADGRLFTVATEHRDAVDLAPCPHREHAAARFRCDDDSGGGAEGDGADQTYS